MIDPAQPAYIPILLPSDAGLMSQADTQDAVFLSAVYGVNPRLAGLVANARQITDTLLVDPKTPYFQFAGYMSMPDYRALPYSPGRGTLGSIWEPAHFRSASRRDWLIEEVFAVEAEMGADILLAPYFYVRSVKDPWLAVARDCAKEALQARVDRPVGVVLSIDIDAFIDASHRATLCAAFADLEADLFWVNVVNYDEIAAEPTDVDAVMALIDTLVATERPVVLGYVARTGLLGIARGTAGYAAGTHGLISHPRSFFREMMGSKLANSYYVRECMADLPVRVAEAALNSGVDWQDIPCGCDGCQGSTAVSRMVSRRLSQHAIDCRERELDSLLGIPPKDRLEALMKMFDTALGKCEAVASALRGANGEPALLPGTYHYLEVLRQAAGGPPATIPGDDSF
jgi:hypothetical protein